MNFPLPKFTVSLRIFIPRVLRARLLYTPRPCPMHQEKGLADLGLILLSEM